MDSQDPAAFNISVINLPVSDIGPSMHQVRKDFDEEGLRALADSIEKEGLIQPVTVRNAPQGHDAGIKYELIVGERRWRASKLLGRSTIAAIVIEVPSEAAAAAKGLVENVQRQELNPIEEAEGYRILNKLDPDHWDQAEIAKVAGKPRIYVTKSLLLLDLPEPILKNVRQRTFSREHGLELLRLQGRPEQAAVAKRVEEGLSVKKTRLAIDAILASKISDDPLPAPPAPAADPSGVKWSDLRQYPQSHGAWSVAYKGGKWQFEVESNSEESLFHLEQWFELMTEMLKQSLRQQRARLGVEDPTDPSPESAAQIFEVPPGAAEADSREPEFRLPKTPEETAELNALALKGPGPFYAWIFGIDHPMAKETRKLTWKDCHVDDPLKASQDFVASLKGQ